MYLKNDWYVAMWSENLQEGQLVSRTLLGETIVFMRDDNGHVAALQDRCPHRFAPLSMGKCLAGGHLRCAYHGLEFDSTGACVKNPHGSGRIPPAAKVKSYPVHEKHSLVWIWMGDKRPDPTSIPDYSFLEGGNGALMSIRDRIVMEASHELIIENLLDLSHASYLHDGVLGSEATVSAEIEVEQGDRQLTVKRWMPNVPSTQLFDTFFGDKGRHIDMWFNMRWHAPSALVNDVGATEVGAEKGLGYRILGAHLLTPETETTTHYYFAAALYVPPGHDHSKNVELGQQLSQIRRYAFEEQDAPIIKAQQREILKALPAVLKPALFEVDIGPVRYRRMMAELLALDSTA